jgi:hypothetical protein
MPVGEMKTAQKLGLWLLGQRFNLCNLPHRSPAHSVFLISLKKTTGATADVPK